MRIYFIKAEYTDGIYKLDDFFIGNVYKQERSKRQDIDIKPNDGNTTTVVNTILPDGTNVNDYSHIIVPEANKIYEIDRCLWLNNTQTQISLIEDAFIGHYQQVKDKRIRLERTNDVDLFKGIHDVEDITVRPTLETLGTGSTYTGQWVLYFIDPASAAWSAKGDDDSVPIYKLKELGGDIDSYSAPAAKLSYYDNTGDYKDKYPEIYTSNPLAYNYFNKSVRTRSFDKEATSYYHQGSIKWNSTSFVPMVYETDSGYEYKVPAKELYIQKSNLANSVELASDLSAIVLAFPLEKNIGVAYSNYPDVVSYVMPYTDEVAKGLASSGLVIRGVKIVNESQIFNQDAQVVYNPEWPYDGGPSNDLRTTKTLIANSTGARQFEIISVYANKKLNEYTEIYDDTSKSMVPVGEFKGSRRLVSALMLNTLNPELTLSKPQWSGIFDYEPFKKYSVTVFGKEYKVAKKNLDTLKIRFAVSMNSIEYFGYINNDLSQKLFSDSYSTDINWSMDQLDLFNQQNPTYKDQFSANMWRKGLNSFASAGKGAALGAISKGGPAGALIGGGIGLATSAMNIGFDIHAEKLRQKGLELAPDQVFGDGSNISLASQSKYGVFVNTYFSDFEREMTDKYMLSGFPTTSIRTIEALKPAFNSVLISQSKVIMGQLLETVKNKYITNAINRKLQEGVIIV